MNFYFSAKQINLEGFTIRIQNSESRIQNEEYRIFGIFRILDSEFWILNSQKKSYARRFLFLSDLIIHDVLPEFLH